MGNDLLFSGAMEEFAKLYIADPQGATDRMKWLTGNWGHAGDLHSKRRVAVPPDRVMAEGFTPDQTAIALTERKSREALMARFVDPLSDDEVPNELKGALSAMRDIAELSGCVDISVPIVRRVKAGGLYRMKQFAALCGPCHEDFTYLQGWNFDDAVTESGRKGKELLVFGGPWPLLDSEGKTTTEQETLLAKVSKDMKLTFKLAHGSVALGTLVLQSHELLTGKQHPLNNRWVRTATVSSSGGRLGLRRVGGRLRCGYWDWDDDNRRVGLGCLALGVKVLGR